MLTLFGNLDSGNVHKVQMILRRIARPYARVDVAQTRGEPRDPHFLAINPMGKVPAIMEESGAVLTESGAILYHFSQGTPLWPDALDERTQVLRWMFFEQYSHEPTLAVMRYLQHFSEPCEANATRAAALEPGARHALGVMETRLAAHDWLAARACSIADYALYPYTRVADSVGLSLDEFPAIERWLARVESQPDFLAFGDDGAVETVSFTEYFAASA